MSQDQQNETERSSKSVASILVWIFTVAVVYLLSFGPAVGLYDRTGPHGPALTKSLMILYAPVLVLRESVIGTPLDWWSQYWVKMLKK